MVFSGQNREFPFFGKAALLQAGSAICWKTSWEFPCQVKWEKAWICPRPPSTRTISDDVVVSVLRTSEER